jgi:hypothetical protein
MTKNPEVLGQCRGVPGGVKRKGKEERRGESEVERGERARGAFCGVERRRMCFTLQRILAPICEIKKEKEKESWCGGGVERKELNWGGFGRTRWVWEAKK